MQNDTICMFFCDIPGLWKGVPLYRVFRNKEQKASVKK